MWNICSWPVCSCILLCNYLWARLQWDLWIAKYYQWIRLLPEITANAAANCNGRKMSFLQGLPDTCPAIEKFPSHEEMELNGSPQPCSSPPPLKAFKLFLASPLHLLHRWLSSLLQRKQSSVLPSTGFKGGHL